VSSSVVQPASLRRAVVDVSKGLFKHALRVPTGPYDGDGDQSAESPVGARFYRDSPVVANPTPAQEPPPASEPPHFSQCLPPTFPSVGGIKGKNANVRGQGMIRSSGRTDGM